MDLIVLGSPEYLDEPDNLKQRILTERGSLLESIEGLRASENVDVKGLSILNTKFNLLVSRLDSLRSRTFRDPFDALPYEVWTAIILEAATIGEGNIFFVSVDILLHFSLVSSEWREGIFSTPTLWTSLYITNKVHDLAVKVHLGLYLSKVYPIDLVIENEFEGAWEDIAPIVVPESHRFQSITILQPSQDLEVELNALESLRKLQNITSIKVFPKLSYKSSTSSLSSNLEILLSKTPNLRQLYGVFIFSMSLNNLNLQSLETVSVDVASGPFHPSPRLRNMKIGNSEELAHYNILTDDQDEPLLWESLTIQGSLSTSSFQKLHQRSAESLLTFYISTYCSAVTSLFWVCNAMPLLRDLRVGINYAQNPSDEPPLREVSLPSLRCLDIAVSWVVLKDNYNRQRSPRYSHLPPRRQKEKAQGLFNLIMKGAPNVEYLTVKATHALPEILSYAGSLSQLSACGFRFGYISHIPLNTQIICLRSHCLTFSGPATALELLSGNDLWFMQVSTPDFVKSVALDANHWPNLRTLDLQIIPKAWDHVFLPHLQKLRLRSQGWVTLQMEYTSPLLEKIARDPTTFPGLEILELESIPEWDLLMIMLECRNCSINSDLTRIKSISVPTLPSPFIIKPLSQLLRGELPIRYSAYDYSMAGIAPAYFDMTVTGCSDCHLLHLPCSQPVIELDDWGISGLPVGSEHLTEYPTSYREIIATWRDRYGCWMEHVEKLRDMRHHLREGMCAKHELGRLCEITGYTLHGSNISREASLHAVEMQLL